MIEGNGNILIGFIKVYFRNTRISNLRYTYMSIVISFIVLAYFFFGVSNIPAINIYCILTTCQHDLRKPMAVKNFSSIGCFEIGLFFFKSTWRDRPFNKLSFFLFFSICWLFVTGKTFVGNKLSKTWDLTPLNILALFCVLVRMQV